MLEGFADFNIARNRQAWPTPIMLSWEQWVQSEWIRLTEKEPRPDSGLLLSDEQERLVWERVIEKRSGSDGSALVQSATTVRTAKDTWRLIHDWRLPITALSNTLVEDTQVYYEWVTEFISEKDRQRWLTRCEINGKLVGALQSGMWRPRHSLVFVGFDEWLPAQRCLFDCLQAAGVDLYVEPAPGLEGTNRVIACPDQRRELEAAAQWARNLLVEGEKGGIGIIVDDLVSCRDQVETIFDQALHGDESLSHDPDRVRAFHISLGKSLESYPIVRSAIGLLGLMGRSIPIADITSILHTPFVAGGVEESSPRSLLDAKLRRRGWEALSLDGLLKQAEAAGTPSLLACLGKAIPIEASEPRIPSEWSALFAEWLSTFGWPGDQGLSSAEFQTVQAWWELMTRFSGLNVASPPLTLRQAVATLRHLASNRIFQPRTPPAPVQIMGVLESSGMRFRYLWVTGMSDDQWPRPLHPNPFLPFGLQKEYELPGVDPDRELRRYQDLTRRLLSAADSTMVSFPVQKEEQILGLSPLYLDLQREDRRYELETMSARQLACSPTLELLLEQSGPPLGNEHLTGGAGIFRDQASCPFKAFARHRLHATGAPPSPPGLNQMQRGNLLHWCMAGVWEELRSHANLVGMSKPDLEKVLRRHVSRATSRMLAQDTSGFRKRLLAIERRRMLDLVVQWMMVESSRPEFSVDHVEHAIEVSFCGLELRLRIDRIDQVEDEGLVIIDYKTGARVKTDQWSDDRPDDPQLPLYLIAYPETVGALAFAHLRKGENCYKGFAKTSGYAQGIEPRPDWPDLENDWRSVLASLAEQFKQGLAVVDPKTSTVCTSCEIKPLCRVFETAVEVGGE